MGLPDRPEAALNDQAGVGTGQFAIQLVTTAGTRIYHFTPGFGGDGTTSENGAFSFAVPWDPNTIRIELLGPGKAADLGQFQGSIVTLASRNVSAKGPTLSGLSASTGKMGVAGATIPVAGPNEAILIGWNQADSDTPAGDLSAILYLIPPASSGLPGQVQAIPFAVNLQGGSFTISADQLAELPGDYGVRLIVSDGVNTTTLETPKLFSVQTGVYLPLVTR
jgi:hypothetical protein